jgi:catechol 2,3-dioxygenase-like lactoylglutathione lyase family enzyme
MDREDTLPARKPVDTGKAAQSIARMASTADVTTERSVTAPVTGLVPMLHVADVERSVAFYELLGFKVGNYVPREAPRMHWAWLYQPKTADWKRGANFMLTRASYPIKADAQAVLFYLYATELVALRNELLAAGVKAGEISYPEYLPKGEFRMEDPDGYCLMVAQSADDTP